MEAGGLELLFPKVDFGTVVLKEEDKENGGVTEFTGVLLHWA